MESSRAGSKDGIPCCSGSRLPDAGPAESKIKQPGNATAGISRVHAISNFRAVDYQFPCDAISQNVGSRQIVLCDDIRNRKMDDNSSSAVYVPEDDIMSPEYPAGNDSLGSSDLPGPDAKKLSAMINRGLSLNAPSVADSEAVAHYVTNLKEIYHSAAALMEQMETRYGNDMDDYCEKTVVEPFKGLFMKLLDVNLITLQQNIIQGAGPEKQREGMDVAVAIPEFQQVLMQMVSCCSPKGQFYLASHTVRSLSGDITARMLRNTRSVLSHESDQSKEQAVDHQLTVALRVLKKLSPEKMSASERERFIKILSAVHLRCIAVNYRLPADIKNEVTEIIDKGIAFLNRVEAGEFTRMVEKNADVKLCGELIEAFLNFRELPEYNLPVTSFYLWNPGGYHFNGVVDEILEQKYIFDMLSRKMQHIFRKASTDSECCAALKKDFDSIALKEKLDLMDESALPDSEEENDYALHMLVTMGRGARVVLDFSCREVIRLLNSFPRYSSRLVNHAFGNQSDDDNPDRFSYDFLRSDTFAYLRDADRQLLKLVYEKKKKQPYMLLWTMGLDRFKVIKTRVLGPDGTHYPHSFLNAFQIILGPGASFQNLAVTSGNEVVTYNEKKHANFRDFSQCFNSGFPAIERRKIEKKLKLRQLSHIESSAAQQTSQSRETAIEDSEKFFWSAEVGSRRTDAGKTSVKRVIGTLLNKLKK